MEHVPIVVETQKAAGGVEALGVEEVGERALASRCVDPFGGRAISGVAVEVDAGGPTRDDGIAVEAIAGNGCGVRIHRILSVAKDGAGVVAYTVVETSIFPGLQDIPVVQTGDSRRNESTLRECGRVAANGALGEPLLVELDLLEGVGVGGVIQRKMSMSVRDVQELIAVADCGEPNFQRIEIEALRRDLEGGSPGRQ